MARLGEGVRLAGVDVARGIALIGIMAVHIFPPLTSDGSPHPAFVLDSGRSPALFPILAGVGLALAHGGGDPPSGPRLWSDRAGVVARAGVLVLVGLLLGRVDSPPLVILIHFGFMFLVAAVFLGLRTRSLVVLCGLWTLAVPQLSHLLRTGPAGGSGSPHLPGALGVLQPLVDLALTSAYPVLVWTAYVLAGMAIGRAGLAGRRPVQLIVGGALLAVLAKLISMVALAAAGGADRLAAHTEGLALVSPDIGTQLQVGFVGTVPTTDWRWLLVSAAHSSTTLDLLHTGGAAVAILGACLLAVRRFGDRPFLALAAVGSMTLTLYTAHVLALWQDGPLLLDDAFRLYVVHVALVLVVAVLWRSLVGRGPLEAVAARLERATRSGAAALIAPHQRAAHRIPTDGSHGSGA